MAVPAGLATALHDRYRLQRELGQGGMATVYLAQDVRHGRDVALKVLRPELAAVLGRERFLAEIRLTAKLDHPHILTLIDSGESDGLLWYVVPFVRGESLRQKLRRETQLEVAEALAIAIQIAGALDYAHRSGVIHRDLKPENILLHEGEAMLADFGIALALKEAGGSRLTETGLSLGTPQYMSPEQATAERNLDARSDVYSLGAVLYEMLAGEPPFTGVTAQAVIAKLMTERPTRLRTVRESVSVEIDAAVARALAKVPADRFPSAAAFAAALRAPPSEERIGRSRIARRSLAAVALVAALAAVWRYAPERGSAHAGAGRQPASLYARAIREYDRRTAGGAIEAIREFTALVARDSAYAPAWTGLARACVLAYEREFAVPGMSRDSLLRLAIAAADRAIALDGGSAEAWFTRAVVTRAVDPTDLRPADRAIRRALVLNPTSAPAWHFLALESAESGNLAAADSAWHRSVREDPRYAEALAFLALAKYWRRQYDSAAVWADSAIVVDPSYLLGRTVQGLIAVEQGRYARGAAAFEAARRLGGDVDLVNLAGVILAEARAGRRTRAQALLQQAESLAAGPAVALHTAVRMAQAYVGLGDPDGAFEWLSRYRPTENLDFQLHLRCDPPFDPIARDPRFQSLLVRPRPPPGGC